MPYVWIGTKCFYIVQYDSPTAKIIAALYFALPLLPVV